MNRIVALALLCAFTPRVRELGEARQRGRERPAQYAFFEFAPTDGAGMPAVCSTTAPTGAKGEVLTFTRATAATCQATGSGGMVSTGIANGDLSTVASGVVRVEYNRNGVKGVRTESARTNSDLRNTEFDNVAWAESHSGGPVAPAVTANAGTAPDGTATADRIVFPSCAAPSSSVIYQLAAAAGVNINSIYAKSNTASAQTISVCEFRSTGAAGSCTPCTAAAGSWSRCTSPTYTTAGASGIVFGCNSLAAYSGSSNTGAADVLVSGAQTEVGATASSLNYTTSASVTRNADVVSLPVTLSGATFSAAISYDAPSALVSGATAFQVYVDANNSVTAALDGSSHVTCTFRIGGADSTVTSTATLSANAVNRVACTYGASGRSACVGGVCTTTSGALTMPTGAATFYVGTRSATGNESNGVMSQGCYDPLDTRCI